MTRLSLLRVATTVAVGLLAVAWDATPLRATPEGAPAAWPGPPWISIEIPPNPFDDATRDAVLVVHTYHHNRVAAFAVSGMAEGLVNGERRSLPLELTATSRAGVYALKRQWPTEGTWLLVITVTGAGDNTATALVELGPNGEVTSVRVPTKLQRGWIIPEKVTAEEIDGVLRARNARLSDAG